MSLTQFFRKNTMNLARGAVLALLFSSAFNLNAAQPVKVQSQTVKTTHTSSFDFSNGKFFVDLHYNPAFTHTTQKNGITISPLNSTDTNLLALSAGDHKPAFAFGWLAGGLGAGYKLANGFSAAVDFNYMNLASDWEEKEKKYELKITSDPKNDMKTSAAEAQVTVDKDPYTIAGDPKWGTPKTPAASGDTVPTVAGDTALAGATPNKFRASYVGHTTATEETKLMEKVNSPVPVAYNYKGFHLISGLVKLGYDYDFMDSFGAYADLGLGASYLMAKDTLANKISGSFHFTGSAGVGASYAFSEQLKLKLGYQLFWTPAGEFDVSAKDADYTPPKVTFAVTSTAFNSSGTTGGTADTISTKVGEATPAKIEYTEQQFKAHFGHLMSHSVNLAVNFTF